MKGVIILLLAFNFCYGQNNVNDTSKFICVNPETPPEFIGGDRGLLNYLSNSMHNKIQFTKEDAINIRTVYAKIIINEKGKVDSVFLMRSSNIKKLDSLFIFTLKNMPDWKPGTLNGKPIRQRMNIPYRVELR